MDEPDEQPGSRGTGPTPAGSVPGPPVVRVAGELDADRAGAVLTELIRAVATGSGDVVADVSAVTFCDSSGLNALLRARMAAGEAGRRLCLAGANPQLERLLELTGVRPLFPVVPVP
ncbi:anti-sigma factor antagonist [Streptomyces subrutilus]|uniref:Anti-sigma factor antagonist n=1 Tax=Streptomyces subrutilus TaxID=36818 RepID=A0A5P2UG40_9ACTN|nr:STAS domain-containing protein [Streptomyces subrutilus]QEU77425.1 anti-sigma factor antagonist [Streptomyces subrutilus]GGZ47347.1 anti-sigma factor antagonist [Streptomyces subrutilus]